MLRSGAAPSKRSASGTDAGTAPHGGAVWGCYVWVYLPLLFLIYIPEEGLAGLGIAAQPPRGQSRKGLFWGAAPRPQEQTHFIELIYNARACAIGYCRSSCPVRHFIFYFYYFWLDGALLTRHALLDTTCTGAATPQPVRRAFLQGISAARPCLRAAASRSHACSGLTRLPRSCPYPS